MVVPVEFVMDASFSIPWIFRDEVDPLADEAWTKLVGRNAMAHVPGLWPMEIVNVTLRGPRKGKPRPTESDITQFFTLVGKMPLRVHHQGIETFLTRVPTLARKHKLSVYDCAYLVLALSIGLPLATRDENMAAAAAAEGVVLVT